MQASALRPDPAAGNVQEIEIKLLLEAVQLRYGGLNLFRKMRW